MSAWLECWMKYAVFSGRAGRKEYWMFVLINGIISVMLSAVMPLLSLDYSLVALLPSLSVGVRRFHDIGRSGKSFACYIVPIYVCIVLIPFLEWATKPRVGLIPQDSIPIVLIPVILFLPMVLSVMLICVLARRGQPQTNQYGEPPVA